MCIVCSDLYINYLFLLSQIHLKKAISTAISSDEKINDQVTFKLFDGSTNPKNINSDMTVGLRLKKGMNKVKT